ncbi:TonB-dependent receptor plug domain-containing protein [Pelagicoccus mobilis]|uniref:TonB-dependent receptor plug domain-containing protein n=1 Tax=Pelagicoccus mobilis TaxID=415221 RepID=A0A934S6A3_9BACT|nr:TonB-dependent receptor plug domain-containing protein [Pelagicoccus mobilis]MBK1879723.1 hypothetical protein [Pelagicoccus mobilis]
MKKYPKLERCPSYLMRKFTPMYIGAALLPVVGMHAQEADESEDVFELSPFTVEASNEGGYTTEETLAGTRIRTNVRDLAASISTVTETFLRDTGVTGAEDLLTYTPSTETGGLEGNFSGLGNTGNLEEELIAPHTNSRVRGLSSADNTRDFFRTDIPWDSYNVDAVTIQRGPNSVLFGVAGASGIVNSALKKASFQDQYRVENTLDEFGRVRFVLDANKVLIEDKMAFRLIGLDDAEKYRQDEAYKDTQRIYATLQYNPQIIGGDQAPTNIQLSYEHGDIAANSPRFTPPDDRITAFFDPNGLNRQVFHPQAAWKYGMQMDRGTRVNDDYPDQWEPWVGQQNPGLIGTNPTFIIDNVTGQVTGIQQMQARTEESIGGFADMIRMNSVAGFNEYAQNVNGGTPGSFPGASTFWKNRVVQDTNIFDFYNHLIDGDNKREYNDFEAFNASISQTFLDGNAGVELFFDRQSMTRGGDSYYQNSLSIDINTHKFVGDPMGGSAVSSWDRTGLEPDEVPDFSTVSGGVVNPNVGRAFVSGDANGREYSTTRKNSRLTGFYKLDLQEKLDDSFFGKLLGRHTFTGLFQKDNVESSNRSYRPFATDYDWVDTLPLSDSGISGYDRKVSYVQYVSGDLRNANVADGLGILPVNGRFSPSGLYSIGYFDGTWNANGVNPEDVWIRPLDGREATQKDNPDNYVGWTTNNFNILNVNNPYDYNKVHRSANKSDIEIESLGVTWQARLLDGHIIPTYGYREDTSTTFSATAPVSDPRSGAVDPNFDLFGQSPAELVIKGETTSWGVVLKTPEFINDKLPFFDDFTFFYGESENFIPADRVGYDGSSLPNESGESKDYGLTFKALDGKMSVKATWFETSQKNAQIPGGDPLGSNSWFLVRNNVWQIGHALKMERIRSVYNADPSADWNSEIGWQSWAYNYAWPDDGYGYDAHVLPTVDPDGNELASPFDHPSLKAQEGMIQAVWDNLFPQEWYDAYGWPIDVAKLKSDDPAVRAQGITDPNFAVNTSANIVSMQPSGNGSINGLTPIGTVDQHSEGFEFEFSFQVNENWHMWANAVKTEASRGSIGENFAAFLQSYRNLYDSPAGDIRQWWAGDRASREYFEDFIWKPYLFQQEAEGLPAPEIRPWRFNFVNNYEFKEGKFDGVRVGLGYRWEDDLIVGNGLNSAQDNLDPNDPIYGGSTDNIDLWVGYNRDLRDSINWDIQLNLKGVGDDVGLVPVSVNPDGSIAAMRIREGMRWELRNTFKF